MSDQAHEIHISIGPDGKITSEVKGVAGPSCAGLSKWLDDMGKVEEDSMTADFRKTPQQTVRNGH
jgi:hypothetical protein